MKNHEPPAGRDQENPDPQELHRPIPKIFLVLVALLLTWAVYYIASQKPGLGSSSTPEAKQSSTAAPTARAG